MSRGALRLLVQSEAEAPKSSTTHLGLGLFIVREIVKRREGRSQ
ncbi:Hypothetical protein A7982_08150 [Minicystis rosea]|nr:Hypothetical protein A7982_08150 [Minicystis rosea]